MIRREKIQDLFGQIIGNQGVEDEKSQQTQVDFFKKKFAKLSNVEIKSKLHHELTPEAEIALKELLAERESQNI